jgi:non-ribosomal peptide synthetase component F
MDKSVLPERLSLSSTKPERSSVSQGPSVAPIIDWVSSYLDAPANSTPILSEAERQRLLVEFNDTSRDYPRDARVHELFEQQVERTPDAVALVFEDQQLSYRELNERSNRLARYLQARGVTTQTPVGLCVERSLDLVVSILGIFKAGGTYVPLDAEYPARRLEYMLGFSGAKYLVTDSDLLAQVPATDRIDICID